MTPLRLSAHAEGNGSSRVRVDAGDLHVSQHAGETLLTYALGSCLAVALHDRETQAGGLAHIHLPAAGRNWGQRPKGLWPYADLAIPELFRRFSALNGTRRDVRVVIAGGAETDGETGARGLGRRNILAIKRLLKQQGCQIIAEDVGGTEWRLMRIHIGTGCVEIQTSRGIRAYR